MRSTRGFTLIELLVAISVMALLALMSWRGLDSMARAQAQNRERGDALLTLQTSLAQWNADLDAAVMLSQIDAIDWDGRALRLTRRSTDSAAASAFVVAWTVGNDPAGGTRWRRWQSPPLTTRDEWQQAWDRAKAWAQDGGSNEARGAETSLLPAESWQLLYFRNDTWGPAAGSEALGATPTIPDGIRLVLNLPPGPALAGTLTRDWVRPAASVPKS